ncbi:MAG: phosphoribosylformimino-5-aminoimidazole carboxamide ribotide isomerase [Lachnospiraceae bacterium]|nr:phosphoribosylformimino-5-aminoimidazole carboxamide ribotide isomerase [Lachnospiraceae bacterium]MDE7200350.1 phosphoribosylformimino-5-aminoimidazole carboxamide ribotide isomerase [Lachnospiraceae bacterium]
MEFRPCIDIHNGQVKQIVGSSLEDQGDLAKENFVAVKGAEYYARLYQENRIKGGHIILLNPVSSPYYEATRAQAMRALATYPGGLQVGGGVNAANAAEYLDAGASHVIVTSYVFQDGHVNMEHLDKICRAVGKEHLVLDLSCRIKNGSYYIVTDRWQKFTEEKIDGCTLDMLMGYCDEFLIHAVDVEGKSQGIEETLVRQLGVWCSSSGKIAVTYAGGVHDYADIELLRVFGGDRINVTIGSALDIFGGRLAFDEVLRRIKN